MIYQVLILWGVCAFSAVLLSVFSIYYFKKSRDLAPLFQRKNELQCQINSLNEQIAVAQNTNNALTIKNQELNKESKMYEQSILDGKIAKEFLDKYDEELARKRSTIYKTNNDIENVKDIYNKAKEELTNINLEIQNAAGKLQGQEQQLNKNEQIIAEIEVKKGQLIEKEKALFQLTEKVETLKVEFEELETKCKRLKNDIERMEEERKRLDSSCLALEEEEKRYRESIRALNAEKSTLDLLLDTKKAEAKGIEDFKWEDLDKRPIPLVKLEKHIEEHEFLSGFKDKLRQNNIVFDDRTINAFHTSLKVQDSSPLVVLAGISGTGKSLLPQLYASELGFNFLQIAVQPRWDGPQDLFGFYNYMENRFKATELSRLIWSCDIYNNKKAEKEFSGDDKNLPMNIVLLDEMNLAKVEYYFSDMLSKLEARRGKNCSIKNQREPAEIELECGSSGKDIGVRRMFVNKNTLFVGTMNEDESTQSLSDKVMDRSNVMRFGRPSSLDLHPTIDKFLKSHSDEKLTYGTWSREWVKKSIEKSDSDFISKIITPINEELARIGRPFAHRVYQGISNYVVNYPDSTEIGRRYAIADQVEMKILPKLTGIEMEDKIVREVLEKIGEHIDKINDRKLSEAFFNARKSDNSVFFQWRGIMR